MNRQGRHALRVGPIGTRGCLQNCAATIACACLHFRFAPGFTTRCAPPRARRRGLHGRKLEAGFSGRQDLLLFGEEAGKKGAEKLSERDTWIGLDTSAAGSSKGAAVAEAGAGGGHGSAKA